MRLLLLMPKDTASPLLARLLVGEVMEPLSLTYLASAAREGGHDVRIIDRRVTLVRNGFDVEAADRADLALLLELQPDMVGIHLSCSNLRDASVTAEIIRKHLPKTTIIGGGPHPTMFPESSARVVPTADLLVVGDGEETLRDLLAGKPAPTVPGVVLVGEGGRVKLTQPRALLANLDRFPLPARDLLDLDFYLNPNKNILVDYRASLNRMDEIPRMGELLTSRGCPFDCAFCAVPMLSHRKMRYHSPEWIVADMTDLVRSGANYVYFNDDNFTASRRRCVAVCEAIQREFSGHIPWVVQSRVEAVDRELLGILRDAGCVRIEFGFESGSQRLLVALDKRTQIRDYYRAADLAREAGLAFQANVIVGCPGETRQDANATLGLLRDTKPDSVLLNVFWPLPGSRIWDDLTAGSIVPRSPTVRGSRLSIDSPPPMPAHPVLAQQNYSDMSDDLFIETILDLLEFAPESRRYLVDNIDLFEQAIQEIGGLMAGRLPRG